MMDLIRRLTSLALQHSTQLTAAFLVLKVTGQVSWSYWQVLAPTLLPLALRGLVEVWAWVKEERERNLMARLAYPNWLKVLKGEKP